jgi:PHD/YefM family antitoxin component YafN of YafNO toxin-antitoxin module
MTTQRYDSATARVKFDEIIEALRQGIDVIFEQEGNPLAVAIPFEDFLAIEEELDDARAGRRAQAILEAWKRDPSLAPPVRRSASRMAR